MLLLFLFSRRPRKQSCYSRNSYIDVAGPTRTAITHPASKMRNSTVCGNDSTTDRRFFRSEFFIPIPRQWRRNGRQLTTTSCVPLCCCSSRRGQRRRCEKDDRFSIPHPPAMFSATLMVVNFYFDSVSIATVLFEFCCFDRRRRRIRRSHHRHHRMSVLAFESSTNTMNPSLLSSPC